MNKLNILLIDHSEEVCDNVKNLLETNDAVKEIHTTTSLVKGLQMLEHVAVDIVILDVTISNYNEPAIRSILNIRVLPIIVLAAPSRSEERRVGKECRLRWLKEQEKTE